MILYRWHGTSSNFGDELNTVLWPLLLPGLFDDDQAVRFLGIGSVLDGRHPKLVTKLVAGAGYGGYEKRPELDRSWIIHWVRGPRTASALGLPATVGLGDPAVLVPAALNLAVAKGRADGKDIGFMPHFESAAWGAWQQATALAGLRLIDPRGDPLAILHEIRGCRLLLSEALHGVIVADAMRVPWVAIRPLARVHRAKWLDWADTVELRPRFCGLPASTLREWVGTSRLRALHAVRTHLDRHPQRPAQMFPEWLIVRAAAALRLAANALPQQSGDNALDRCQSRMLDAVQAIRAHALRPPSHVATIAQAQSGLQTGNDSAYQLTPIG